MAHVITSACGGTKDGACVRACPVDCIHTEAEDPVRYIDPSACIDCRGCVVSCPTEAIYLEADVPGPERPWIEINALWYEDPSAARARIRALGSASSLSRPEADGPLQNPAGLR